jgi:hypothetical protein
MTGAPNLPVYSKQEHSYQRANGIEPHSRSEAAKQDWGLGPRFDRDFPLQHKEEYMDYIQVNMLMGIVDR